MEEEKKRARGEVPAGEYGEARARAPPSARILIPFPDSYEKRIKLKSFWQSSLPHEFFNATSREHAVL